MPQCLLSPRGTGARSVGEEQSEVSSPRTRAKLAIGNELQSEGAKDILNRWAGTEAGVQVYFYWSLAYGKCVAFPASRHRQSGKAQWEALQTQR